MFIFDDLIGEIKEVNNNYTQKELLVDLKEKYNENPNQFIFNSDKAFELGATPFYGINLDLLSDDLFVDQIILIGDDLNKIKKDQSYARITLASIDKNIIGEGNKLFNNIRRFNYTKYHFAYNGVMVRESSFKKKESLLISKQIIKEDTLNFSKLGSYFINKYKELDFVKNIKIIFITLDDYKYDSLISLVNKSENITKALDHLLNKVKMDCHSCSLQVICNEVEKKVKSDFNS